MSVNVVVESFWWEYFICILHTKLHRKLRTKFQKHVVLGQDVESGEVEDDVKLELDVY